MFVAPGPNSVGKEKEKDSRNRYLTQNGNL